MLKEYKIAKNPLIIIGILDIESIALYSLAYKISVFHGILDIAFFVLYSLV